MRTAKPPEITERVWQSQLTGLAKTLHWRVYHTFLSRWSDAGFPDLVLIRERVIYCECKRESGKLSPPQVEWREALLAAGAEWYCWRPSDWDVAVEVLQRR